MTIQVHTHNNTQGSDALIARYQSEISAQLKRFEDRITSFEVYLSDENGKKEGDADKKCVIEARIKGMQPHAVTAFAESHDFALRAACDKMKSVLGSVFEKQRNH